MNFEYKYINEYFNLIHSVLNKVESNQLELLDSIAELIVNKIEKNKDVGIYIKDYGHAVHNEFFGRCGGLVLVKSLPAYQNSIQKAPRAAVIDAFKQKQDKKIENKIPQEHFMDEDYQEVYNNYYSIFGRKDIGYTDDDVLFVGSFSGVAFDKLALAQAWKDSGKNRTLIAITSKEFSNTLNSSVRGNIRLYDIADYTIENYSDIADANLKLDGMDVKMCPTSSFSAMYSIWILEIMIAERFISKGMIPSVLQSVNLQNGHSIQDNNNANRHYSEYGY